MKKLLTICILCAVLFVSTSCVETKVVSVNVENQETLMNNILGVNALIEIGNGLYYDSTTRIVYWWNGVIFHGLQSSTTPTPYYAPNGLPYKYNTETNTFEEIER